jgi:hypothetical protein
MEAGLAAGIAGGAMGVMGGAIGTYYSIRHARGPRERALTIRLALLSWLWLAILFAWVIGMPRPWNQAAMLLNLPYLGAIPWMNRNLARAPAEDEAFRDRDIE